MRILLPTLAIACSSDQVVDRPRGDRPGWEDPTKASTVGTRFVVTFPNLPPAWVGKGRALIFRSDLNTEATVTQIAAYTGLSPDHAERFDIPAGQSRLDLAAEPWVVQLFPSNTSDPIGVEVENWNPTSIGLVVEVDAPVELLALYDGGSLDRAITRILPVEELGLTYRAALPWAADGLHGVHYAVVAVEDDTEVQGSPWNEEIRLDAGESVRIGLTPDEVMTEQSWPVSADKPIAVFTGGIVNCPNSGGAMTWEQLPPVFRWATEYLALPIPEHAQSELVIVAEQAATGVSLDCRDFHVLEAGEVLRLDLAHPKRIRSTLPILALTEAPYRHCIGEEEVPAPGLASLTPQTIYRRRAQVRPVELDWGGWESVQEEQQETTVAAVVAEPEPVRSEPVLDVSAAFAPGDSLVDYLMVDQPATLEGDRLRGLEYAVGPATTHVWSLGYDCVDCTEGLAEPKACD